MRLAVPLVLAALALSACGGAERDQVAQGLPTAAAIVADPTAGTTAATGNTALPDLQVVRVASGKRAPLRSLAAPGKPTLLWFWAPHCTFCRAEAPDLLAFQKAYGDQVQILGLGAQDDLDQAVDFLSDTGTQDLEMVWEQAGKSWLHYQVTNQPTVVVLDATGKVTKAWFRHFDADGILEAAGLA
ncbi:TlpA disulfide reductase family protein [Sporichthya sp.]|uniref:TlpA family protein disulfide reductase n=1 Tax=Sporichthya sp. TaxID=65475 RepID=UPI001791F4F4|nr:TlpA disulfide reductase family protein [Sporichthya sp.]MBA3743340.1 TlpA family protein disulfide reductase [Sporichthya sp.]